MGEHEGWAEPPSALLPNGLLPNEAASVMRVLDSERWLKAEERTADLIACIQPNELSEERRNAVADYVQRLIMKCFPCQVKVVTFGSVPLKTYLPDGDIDLTAFSENQNLKETWAHQVRDMLKNEENNENAEFRVKEVQYIQAEVKLIKCLVENIVVDISFDQLGGLCTLCFLLEVDNLINQNHLFKRSIILIKAWCYYESRILGAHHGLISTYALETLVLYIFHVFNNSFAGPLEVLYRFLEFFSKFDWENFCVSLWGPVPISSLPDVTAEPPRKDGGALLLPKSFLDNCSSAYAVFPGGQENQGQPFVSKHFNVIDPLRVNNNLGRSVSKGNFFRIRSAFAFGAKRLARLLDCPKEDLYLEVNQFFTNTWERHGSGHRPDAPVNDLWRLRISNPDHLQGSENVRNNVSSMKNEISSARNTQVEVKRGSCSVSSQHDNHTLDSTSRISDAALVSRTQNQKSYYGNPNNLTDHIRREIRSNHGEHIDKGKKSSKPDSLVNDSLGKFLFARTRSSPELTDTYSEASSPVRRDRVLESGKRQTATARHDTSRRKNLERDVLESHGVRSATEDPSSIRHFSSHKSHDTGADSNSCASTYHDDSGLSIMGEEFVSSFGPQGMQQEEQDLVNLMASSTGRFSGQVHMPFNLASGHLPLPIPPSMLASLGYGHRNFAGIVPANIPLLETPWGTHMQFPQGLMPSQFTHYFSGIGLNSKPEDSVEPDTEQFSSAEMNSGEANHVYWHEQDRASSGGFELDNGVFEPHHRDDNKQSTSAGYNSVHSSQPDRSGNYERLQHKFIKDNQVSTKEDNLETPHYQDNRESEAYFDDRTVNSRPLVAAHASSLRSKTSSESSWEGSSASSAKAIKSSREKRGRKAVPSSLTSSVYDKAKSVSEHSSTQADDDNRDWNSSNMGCEILEGSMELGSVASLHDPRNQILGYEPAQTSGSDSLIPIAPMLLGPGSRQRAMDNSGVAPYTFYPTGPPVPFLTMLPFYNFPTETHAPDASINHLRVEEQLDNSDSGQNFSPSEGHDRLDVSSTSTRSAASVEPSELKPDILHSDFLSHLQNLQYGRFCQFSRNPASMLCPPPVVPPVYLQGRFPWDGPGRPLTANMNLFSQLMNYGPRLVPAAPSQFVSNGPANAYPRYVDEMPRYRSGTGTYLPNPKVSARDRHSSSSRRGNYSYDRNDHHSEREGNWNSNSKPRGAGRSHNRSQAEKQSSRADRLSANGSRADRPWGTNRNDSYASYQSQNGPIRPNFAQSSSANMAYSMYPLPAMNPGGVSSNGPTHPSVVMLYPYDHNTSYGSTAEQLEFGSLGPVGYPGVNEASQLNEGSRSRVVFEEHRFHSSSAQRSSPDQPSSPHLHRSVAPRNTIS